MDSAGSPGGSVDPYRWNGKSWVAEPPFQARPLVKDDVFARSLALDKGTLLVGAWTQEQPPRSDGAAFVFDVNPWYHLMVQPLPLVSNDDGKFSVRNGMPGAATLLFFGTGSTRIPLPWPGATLLVANPILIGTQLADKAGEAVWEMRIPAFAKGYQLWTQAFQVDSKPTVRSSNLIYTRIQ